MPKAFPFTPIRYSHTPSFSSAFFVDAYSLALEIWEPYRKHGTTTKLRVDTMALGVGVEVMVHAGHPNRALALIMDGPVHLRARARYSNPLPHTESMQMAIRAESFHVRTQNDKPQRCAATLGVHGHTVQPHTKRALVHHHARRGANRDIRGDSFAGAIQELGFEIRRLCLPFSKSDETTIAEEFTAVGLESLDSARRRSYEKLERLFNLNEGDMWTSVLLAGWPEHADVRALAQAIRSSGENSATAPFRDLKSFLAPKQPDDDDPNAPTSILPIDNPNDPTPLLLPLNRSGTFLFFSPDEPTFHVAVLLLGIARSASRIPQLLAWMRMLGITPRMRLLSYALVLGAEVSIGAPLLERLRSSGGYREGVYLFGEVMEEWVGGENVPDGAAIGEAMRKVNDMRRHAGRKSRR